MLNLAILLRRNAGAIAITVVAVLIVAVIAGVALTLSAAAQHSTGAAALRPDAAVACAAGRDLTFDPALDAAAADLWSNRSTAAISTAWNASPANTT
jgi:hypothetical protein